MSRRNLKGLWYPSGHTQEMSPAQWRDHTTDLRRMVRDGETLYFRGAQLVLEVYGTVPAARAPSPALLRAACLVPAPALTTSELGWLLLLIGVLLALAALSVALAGWLRWRRWYRDQVLFHVERPPEEAAKRSVQEQFKRGIF